jgi:hypothetical protein
MCMVVLLGLFFPGFIVAFSKLGWIQYTRRYRVLLPLIYSHATLDKAKLDLFALVLGYKQLHIIAVYPPTPYVMLHTY